MLIVLIAGSVLVSLMIFAAFAVRRPRQAASPQPVAVTDRPVLFLDVDGVIALATRPDGEDGGKFFMTDMGMIYVKDAVPGLLSSLARSFDLVWATGWEHHANRELAGVLGLEGELPVLSFGGKARRGTAHWKIEEVERYAGSGAMAWLDDSLDERHDAWAKTRSAPTLLVRADDRVGITADLVAQLLGWAASLDAEPGAITDAVAGSPARAA